MKYYPIIPWIGGKRRLATHILELIPEHKCYVEAFCGAAAIFFAKQSADCEVINDVNGELINLYRVVKNHPETFIQQFKWALSSRQIYEWQKMTVPETLTDIQRAARFFYLQKLSFGGKVDGQTFGTGTTSAPRLNLMRLEEDITQAWIRLQSAYIEKLSWEKVVEKYDRKHSVIFCDPPYYSTEGYGVEFGLEQYDLMSDFAHNCESSVIITVNDIPEMRNAFDGLNMKSLDINYTVGGGKGSSAKELLIWNENCETRRNLKQEVLF